MSFMDGYKLYTITKKYPKLKLVVKATQKYLEDSLANWYSHSYYFVIEDYKGNIIGTGTCSNSRLNKKITVELLDNLSIRDK